MKFNRPFGTGLETPDCWLGIDLFLAQLFALSRKQVASIEHIKHSYAAVHRVWLDAEQACITYS
jgi:hypothetical protein